MELKGCHSSLLLLLRVEYVLLSSHHLYTTTSVGSQCMRLKLKSPLKKFQSIRKPLELLTLHNTDEEPSVSWLQLRTKMLKVKVLMCGHFF